MTAHARVRALLVPAGVVAGTLTASACSSSPPPSAQGHAATTTTTVRAQPTTSTSTSGTAATTMTSGHGGAPGPSPTLGTASAWGASAIGFGHVKPAEISLGGDPTGVLTGISWQSWGGDTATGTGTGTYVAPGQVTAQGVQAMATVVASDLGTCGGGAAYQEVKWYFPGKGETLATGANTTINACSGP
jgi:hypothetical protein